MDDASVKIRGGTYAKLRKIGRENRMSIVDTIDVLADAWPMLTRDDQFQAIRRPDAETRHLTRQQTSRSESQRRDSADPTPPAGTP